MISWFTTLCSNKPLAFPIGEYDRTWTDVNHQHTPFRFEEVPLFVDLTLLENEAIKSLRSGPITIEELSELEHRLLLWQKSLRLYEKQGRGMSGYAVVRHHWYVFMSCPDASGAVILHLCSAGITILGDFFS